MTDIELVIGNLKINDEPSPSLASLPFDILRAIIWDEILEQSDVEDLRLTCRLLADVTATRLFYRISISKLNTDRDAFLSICRTPHLAAHVRELEWLEISWDVDLFQRIASSQYTLAETHEEDDIESLCDYFRTATEAACWLPNHPARRPDLDSEATEATRQKAVANFSDMFESAVDLLPNLHTFVSRPMSSTRIVNPGADYPIAARLFQTFQNTTYSSEVTQTNDGLFLFLLPAMDRPTSTIKALRWADEFPGSSHFRPLPAAAFAGVETLELCLTPWRSRGDEILPLDDLMAACLCAVPTLQHFKLCLEHGVSNQFCPGDLPNLLLGNTIGNGMVTGFVHECALRSLTLVSVDNMNEDRLFNLIEANEHSLRHIRLENIGVKSTLIHRLACIPHLILNTIQVIDVNGPGAKLVDERALVRYINTTGTSRGDGPDDDAVAELAASDPALPWTTEVSHLDVEYSGDWGAPVEDDARSVSSEDSLDRRFRTAPKWIWSRVVHDGRVYPMIICRKVPNSHPGGHATKVWKFTSRDGEVAYGHDPWAWLEDWDPEAGDREEPTPFCWDLREFYRKGGSGRDGWYGIREDRSLDGNDTDWDLVQQLELPEGTFKYVPDEDPGTINRLWRHQEDVLYSY